MPKEKLQVLLAEIRMTWGGSDRDSENQRRSWIENNQSAENWTLPLQKSKCVRRKLLVFKQIWWSPSPVPISLDHFLGICQQNVPPNSKLSILCLSIWYYLLGCTGAFMRISSSYRLKICGLCIGTKRLDVPFQENIWNFKARVLNEWFLPSTETCAWEYASPILGLPNRILTMRQPNVCPKTEP